MHIDNSLTTRRIRNLARMAART